MLCSERTHSAHTAHTSCSDRQLSLRHSISAKDTFSWGERITLLWKMLHDYLLIKIIYCWATYWALWEFNTAFHIFISRILKDQTFFKVGLKPNTLNLSPFGLYIKCVSFHYCQSSCLTTFDLLCWQYF